MESDPSAQTSEQAEKPEAQTEQPPETTPEAAAPLSIGQRITAAFSAITGEGIAAQVAQLTEANKALAASIAEKDKQIASLQGSVATLTEKLTTAGAKLAEAEAAVINFERAVIDRVAQAGIPAAELPAAQAGGESREDKLRNELAETSDPRRKGEIAKELLAFRQGKN